jgi:hypothetical protein
MTKRTWETLGKPAMIPSLGGIRLLRGNMIKLMWKAHPDIYECQWKFDRGRI